MHKYAKGKLFKCLKLFKNIWKNLPDFARAFFGTFSPGPYHEPGLKARLRAGG
jgi:hypothetical protein